MTEASTRKKLVEAAPHASFNLDEIVKTFPKRPKRSWSTPA